MQIHPAPVFQPVKAGDAGAVFRHLFAVNAQITRAAIGGGGGVGFAWLVLVGFVRVSTRVGILTKPLPVADSLGIMDDWLHHEGARVIHPGERHAGVMGALLLAAGTAGNLTNDAHLGALAIEQDAIVGTFDKDFKRFPGVKLDLLKARPGKS